MEFDDSGTNFSGTNLSILKIVLSLSLLQYNIIIKITKNIDLFNFLLL